MFMSAVDFKFLRGSAAIVASKQPILAVNLFTHTGIGYF